MVLEDARNGNISRTATAVNPLVPVEILGQWILMSRSMRHSKLVHSLISFKPPGILQRLYVLFTVMEIGKFGQIVRTEGCHDLIMQEAQSPCVCN